MCAYICIVTFTMIMVGRTNGQIQCEDPPIGCPREKIKYYLYTAVDKPPHELAVSEPETIINAPFIPNADFKFVLHGFMQWKNCPMWLELREEYFKEKPWNIIFIDYSPLARDGCYKDSTFPSIPTIGECAANMLKFLFKTRPEIRIDQFHVIGFSMGAQLAGQVSNYLKPLKLPRITGLDPAFPFFTPGFVTKENVLNKRHARFVDVIHSNMGIFGVYFSNAHYDIYLNNGVFQPGCNPLDPSCSHSRAPLLFVESINSKNKFIADKCDSKVAWMTLRKCTGAHADYIGVGEHSKPPRSEQQYGIYKLKTNNKRPFYKKCW